MTKGESVDLSGRGTELSSSSVCQCSNCLEICHDHQDHQGLALSAQAGWLCVGSEEASIAET